MSLSSRSHTRRHLLRHQPSKILPSVIVSLDDAYIGVPGDLLHCPDVAVGRIEGGRDRRMPQPVGEDTHPQVRPKPLDDAVQASTGQSLALTSAVEVCEQSARLIAPVPQPCLDRVAGLLWQRPRRPLRVAFQQHRNPARFEIKVLKVERHDRLSPEPQIEHQPYERNIPGGMNCAPVGSRLIEQSSNTVGAWAAGVAVALCLQVGYLLS
jgi:hypothetical protein